MNAKASNWMQAKLRRKDVWVVLVLVLIALAGWGLWQYLTNPPRPWIVRWQIKRHLKAQGSGSDFKADFAFPTKAEMNTRPAKSAQRQTLDKGSRTGKSFEVLVHEYVELKTAALKMERDIPQSQAELTNTLSRVERVTRQLASARGAGQTNIASLEGQLSDLERRAELLKKVAAAGPDLQKKEEALAPIVADLWDFQRLYDQEIAATEASGTPALTQARARLADDVQQQFQGASSYGAMYKAIGQELWVADRLMDSRNPDHRRVGVSVALSATRNAMNYTEDAWLAARICEGYIWPNTDVADDPNRRSPYYLENLLNECANIFRRGEDWLSLARNYLILLARADTPQRADFARSEIGTAYEQAGELKLALYYLKQIQATNDYRRVLWRIPRIEQQLKAAAK